MATWKGLGSGVRGALLGVATIVASVGAYGLWDAQRPAVPVAPDATDGVAPETAAPEPATVATQTTTVTTPLTEAVVAEAPPIAPGFDVVRIEPDGSALVAGRAEPGSDVSLQVDGAEVARATTSADGKFVAMFSLIASPTPRLLSLMMTLADGRSVTGPDTVAIAPTTAPVVVAEATPTETATTAPATTGATTTEAATTEAATTDTAATAPAATDTAATAPAATETATTGAATNPPATLLVTKDGVQVLQPGGEVAPEVAAEISLDTIAYSPEGAVQLAGRGTAGQFVRLYLDNSQISLTPLDKLGKWSVTLENITPGIYALRVDQVDAAGKVTSRLETPFKRETLEALAAAMGNTAATATAVPATNEVATPTVTTTETATEAATETATEAVTETATEAVTPEAATEAATTKAATETATTEPAAAQVPAETTSEPAASEPAAAATAATEVATTAAAPSASSEGAATDADTSAAAATSDAGTADAGTTEVAAAAAAPTEAAPTDTATTVSATPAKPVSMIVQPGNTLWAIARQNWGDGVLYVQLWDANKDKIRNPDLIYPGQVFTIPELN